MGVDAGPKVSQIAEAVVLDEDRRGRLVGYACARFGISREDAEDLLQETALELLRCRSHVRNPDGFVFKVFKVRCARHVGSRIGHRRVFADGLGDSAEHAAPAGTDMLERGMALRQALSAVSMSCRRLLSAYYVEGQSLREAARTVSLSDSSVPKTISRCLQRLRRCLA